MDDNACAYSGEFQVTRASRPTECVDMVERKHTQGDLAGLEAAATRATFSIERRRLDDVRDGRVMRDCDRFGPARRS